jgi:hypothetical protein
MRGAGWVGVAAALGLGVLGAGVILQSLQGAVSREIRPRLVGSSSAVERAIGEASEWRVQALRLVDGERDVLEEWDPSAAEFADWDRWRQEALARDGQGYLKRARAVLVRAAALSRAREEEARVAFHRALIEHDAGDHAAELRYARLAVRRSPRWDSAWVTMRRAARCNGPSTQEGIAHVERN